MTCKSDVAVAYIELREQFSWAKVEYQEAAVEAKAWLAESFLTDEFWLRMAYIAKQLPDEAHGIHEQNRKTLCDFVTAISVAQEPLVEWAKANTKQALTAA
jgi:hypothetical protein